MHVAERMQYAYNTKAPNPTLRLNGGAISRFPPTMAGFQLGDLDKGGSTRPLFPGGGVCTSRGHRRVQGACTISVVEDICDTVYTVCV